MLSHLCTACMCAYYIPQSTYDVWENDDDRNKCFIASFISFYLHFTGKSDHVFYLLIFVCWFLWKFKIDVCVCGSAEKIPVWAVIHMWHVMKDEPVDCPLMMTRAPFFTLTCDEKKSKPVKKCNNTRKTSAFDWSDFPYRIVVT